MGFSEVWGGWRTDWGRVGREEGLGLDAGLWSDEGGHSVGCY